MDIDDVDMRGYLVNKDEWTDTTKGLCRLRWQYEQVISADRCYFKEMRVLEMISVILFIVRDQLLRVRVFSDEVSENELN